MFKKVFFFTVALNLSLTSYAIGACSVEEATAKAQEFQQVLGDAVQKNHQKLSEFTAAMQSDLPKVQQANGLDAMCKFYDEWTAKLK